MAVVHAISEHSVVRLREPFHGWPAGTIGTVVSNYGEVMLVEVANKTGKALEFVQARTRALTGPPRFHSRFVGCRAGVIVYLKSQRFEFGAESEMIDEDASDADFAKTKSTTSSHLRCSRRHEANCANQHVCSHRSGDTNAGSL